MQISLIAYSLQMCFYLKRRWHTVNLGKVLMSHCLRNSYVTGLRCRILVIFLTVKTLEIICSCRII